MNPLRDTFEPPRWQQLPAHYFQWSRWLYWWLPRVSHPFDFHLCLRWLRAETITVTDRPDRIVAQTPPAVGRSDR